MSDQTIGIICGVVHLALSFVLALIATFGSFHIFDKLTRSIKEQEELKANNVAVAIVLSGMLLASALVLRSVMSPAISTLQTYLYQGMTTMAWLKLIGFLLGYILGALAATIATIWVGLRCFMALTRRIDEFAEVKGKNVAVAIVLATVLVIMGLFLADGLTSLMEAVVPFPAMPEIQVMTL